MSSAREDRAAAVFSPESFDVSLNSGEHLTRTLQINNIGLSNLETSMLILDTQTLRNQQEQWNPPGEGVNNQGVTVRGQAVRGVEGFFEVLEDTPLRLTCLVMDPETGYIYAQQDNGTAYYRFETETNLWVQLTSCPVSSGNNGGAVLLNGKIYNAYTSRPDLWIYNIALDSWTSVQGMERTANIATDGSKIYVSGDFTLKSYDPDSGIITSLTGPSRLDDNRWGGLKFFNGFLYHHYGDGYNLFDRYNIATGVWQALPDVPGEAVLGSEIAFDQYYTVGSYGGVNLYSYNLITNQWNPTLTLPFDVEDSGLAFYGQSIYVIQGEAGVGFAALRLHPRWARISKFKGLIASGDSMSLDINFNTELLSSGVYLAEIKVETNDPVNPSAVVPVTLRVTDAASLGVSPSSLDFGSVFVGGKNNQVIHLVNRGSLPLEITNISSDTGAFTINQTSYTLAPGEEDTVIASFIPTVSGPTSGQLSITSNGGSASISLEGIGEPPPEIEITPTSFSLNLLAGQGDTQTLTITNIGSNTLSGSLTESSNWISLSPTSFNLASGDSEDVTLTITTTGLTEGSYSEDITIISNDPSNDNLPIPVNLTLTGDANIYASPSITVFSSVALGHSTFKTLTVGNSGTGSADITSITSSHLDFSAEPTSFTLEAGQRQYVLLTFTPGSLGLPPSPLPFHCPSRIKVHGFFKKNDHPPNFRPEQVHWRTLWKRNLTGQRTDGAEIKLRIIATSKGW